MKQTTEHIHKILGTHYPPEEIRCFIRLILSYVCGLSHNQQILCKDKQIPEKEKEQIYAIVGRLEKMEPLQYIMGETEFYSMTLNVDPSVLIPRPETEELADMIIKAYACNKGGQGEQYKRQDIGAESPLRILDIGTGSGCIAIALAKNIYGSEVTAVDISDSALQTAVNNASLNDVTVRFIKADILNAEESVRLIPGKYDIIVSNPPYIREVEKESMEANVLDYEPHTALFVPDEDPLLFYRAIADFAKIKLVSGGMMYFEINAGCDIIMNEMLHEKGFVHTEIHCDLSGKNRFISVKS